MAARSPPKPGGGWHRRPSALRRITIVRSARAWRWWMARGRCPPCWICAPGRSWIYAMARTRTSRRLYGRRGAGIAGAAQLQGKELSYNNLVDLDAAWQLVNEFDTAAAALFKIGRD